MNFLIELVCYVIITFAAFWVIITGCFLIPELVDPITRIIYAVGTICLSVIIMYSGMNYLEFFNNEECFTEEVEG